MSYYFEIWLRGFAKDYLRKISDNEEYHPHITLVRPFETFNEKEVKNTVINLCKNKKPMFFRLEGRGNFDNKFNYVPVECCEDLLRFDINLESALENKVNFAEKLNDKKILHATIDKPELCPRIDQYALRLTGIKNKKIWFSYDFVTNKVLDRDESLNKTNWYRTVHEFTKKYNLLPTRNGYMKI